MYMTYAAMELEKQLKEDVGETASAWVLWLRDDGADNMQEMFQIASIANTSL